MAVMDTDMEWNDVEADPVPNAACGPLCRCESNAGAISHMSETFTNTRRVGDTTGQLT